MCGTQNRDSDPVMGQVILSPEDRQWNKILSAPNVFEILQRHRESIQRHYHCSLDQHHQDSVLILYESIIQKWNGAQHDLVQIKNKMMQQIQKLKLKMDITLWRVFFVRFYELHNEHP